MKRAPPTQEFLVKEISPHLGDCRMSGKKLPPACELVEQMHYLYVRVVKARDLRAKYASWSVNPFVEVKFGNYKGTTRNLGKTANHEWNQVFAFSRIQSSSILEVVVKDNDLVKDAVIGVVGFNLRKVPEHAPPDGPLAPQWYRLEDWNGEKVKGEIMLAVWIGTQADEAFREAWHCDATAVYGEGLANTRSKVYLSPVLWYLRVSVVEAQGLQAGEKGRYPEVYAKASLGNQVMRTRICQSGTINPMWNEDLMFVAAEPFEEPLILSVEDRVGPMKDEVLGQVIIPLQSVQRRLDHKPMNGRWYNLEKHAVVKGEPKKDGKFAGVVHLRVCLDGGYHVFDESKAYSSDLRPTAKQLWQPSVGVLELGVLSAQHLLPLKAKDGRGTTDAYCVAKYGGKWVRTRTIVDSSTPKWNEQYSWEVFDPCTVITVGVFHDCHLEKGDKESRDYRAGKVRIRLSTLESNRVYAHSYPLLVLHPTGVMKMGELQLALRFTCSSLDSLIYMPRIYWGRPLMPKMHYLHPLSVTQLDSLRHQATQIVAMRLSRAEPPLRREVVEYMLDVGSQMWSMRKTRANSLWVVGVLSCLIAFGKWFDQLWDWKNPWKTIVIHLLFTIFVLHPKLILPTMFLCLFLIGVWNYRCRPKQPLHLDVGLSHADAVSPDELDEEFDTFPTSRPSDIVRMRYDRLRSDAGRIVKVVGTLATQAERLHSLLSWRDTRATALFTMFCLISSFVFYFTPLKVVVLVTGFYMLRPPWFRHKPPSAPLNFFRRLPALTDCML